MQNLESLSPKDPLCQVWLKLAHRFLRRFLISSMYFCYFLIISSQKQGVALCFYKRKSSLPKDSLCQVWLKLPQWFFKRFLNFVNVFLLFRNYVPLERGVDLYFNNFNHLYPRILGGVVLEKKMKMWKVHRLTDRRTADNTGSEKLTRVFSLFELKRKTNKEQNINNPKFLYFVILQRQI